MVSVLVGGNISKNDIGGRNLGCPHKTHADRLFPSIMEDASMSG